MFLIFFITIIIFLILFNNFYFKRRNYPPGPCPLPILGNLIPLLLANSPEDTLIEWRRKYGDIYTYWLGENPIVCFNDYESIQTYFKKKGEIFSGRQKIDDFHFLTRGIFLKFNFINLRRNVGIN